MLSALMATPLSAQSGIYMGTPTPATTSAEAGSIVRLTDVLWIERMAKFPRSKIGTYSRCGNYLFVYVPNGKQDGKKAPMVGFAYPNQEGKIGTTVLRNATIVHVKEGGSARVSTSRDAQQTEHFHVDLPKEEIRAVRSCGKVAIEKS